MSSLRGRVLIYGVGINDAWYKLSRNVTTNGRIKQDWKCPYYVKWVGMLSRCYNPKYLKKFPSYAGCHTSKEWLTFSNFREWMVEQDWEGKELDKDLLGDGKLYSPDTCCFISRSLNTFLSGDAVRVSDGLPVGVHYKKSEDVYIAQTNLMGKRAHLGRFKDPSSAHKAYLEARRGAAKELAELERDPRVIKALLERY